VTEPKVTDPESHHRSGLMRWLFSPRQQRFMLPATGAWILGLDWLLFSSNLLSAWLATDPTGSGDDDFLILGDLNSYAMEDPIQALVAAGYTDLLQDFIGPDAYGYVFDGQVGTLDYAMANAALYDQVAGVTEWQVNSDEPDAIDYNTDFGRDASIFDGTVPARNSDHDPVIVGLDLGTEDAPVLLVGRVTDDVLVGMSNDDTLHLRSGNDVATGNDGADTFFFDKRFVSEGEVYRITDLDFSEGDVIRFRYFDEYQLIDSADDLTFFVDNGYLTINSTAPDGSLDVSLQNLDDNFGSDDEIFVGSARNDVFDGESGNDVFHLRLGNDQATGGLGADTFFFDGRKLGPDSTHTITDLDFGEGDTVQLRFFEFPTVELASEADLALLDAEPLVNVTQSGSDVVINTSNSLGEQMDIVLLDQIVPVV